MKLAVTTLFFANSDGVAFCARTDGQRLHAHHPLERRNVGLVDLLHIRAAESRGICFKAGFLLPPEKTPKMDTTQFNDSGKIPSKFIEKLEAELEHGRLKCDGFDVWGQLRRG